MNSVGRIILQRLGLGLVTLFVVSVLIFAAVNMLPGDFAEAILGQGATPEAVAAIREDLGLNKSPVVRYFDWLGGIMTGDFGTSFAQAILTVLLERTRVRAVLDLLPDKWPRVLRTHCFLQASPQ